MGPQQIEQLPALAEPMQPGDGVERLGIRGKQMRLRVRNHLDAMLDSTQQPICLGESRRVRLRQSFRRRQRRKRVQCRRDAQSGIAAAVDHLLDLGEEFDFANASAPALEVIAGTEPRPLGEMVPNPRRNLPDFLDDAEIKRTAPHERFDRLKEMTRRALCPRQRRGRG